MSRTTARISALQLPEGPLVESSGRDNSRPSHLDYQPPKPNRFMSNDNGSRLHFSDVGTGSGGALGAGFCTVAGMVTTMVGLFASKL